MEADSSVREFERLSGGAGIGMISSLSTPNRRSAFLKSSVVIKDKKERKKKRKGGSPFARMARNYGDGEQQRRKCGSRANMSGGMRALSRKHQYSNHPPVLRVAPADL